MRYGEKESIARSVLMTCLQSWGDPPEKKLATLQRAIDFMGLSAKVETVNKESWTIINASGDDTEKANGFMTEIRSRFPMGKFELELAMIEECLEKYKKN